ncbi:MAG: nitrilase-related carbon-nitrogen hydrolase [Pseudomonadota bacterium]
MAVSSGDGQGMRVGVFQFHPTFGDVEGNRQRVCDALAEVEADLLVLPELAFTGYHFVDRAEATSLAEPLDDSPTLSALIDLCRARDLHLVTGFTERAGEQLFNSALLIGPDGLIDCYRKLHLFNTETAIFDPGDQPLRVHEVRGVRLGMMVCFDWAFPEVARTLALRGAQVLCHPSNLVLTFCQQAMITRSIENRVFAVTTNRFGEDRRPHGALDFTGQSQVTTPKGEVLLSCAGDAEALRVVTIDPTEADGKFITPANHVHDDRRPEFYA